MNAVIYARYSSSNQTEASIEGQMRECNEYAKKNGINIVGTYIDRARSATTDNRPDFKKMIRTVQTRNSMLLSYGNLTVSPEIVMIVRNTKPHLKRMELR